MLLSCMVASVIIINKGLSSVSGQSTIAQLGVNCARNLTFELSLANPCVAEGELSLARTHVAVGGLSLAKTHVAVGGLSLVWQ